MLPSCSQEFFLKAKGQAVIDNCIVEHISQTWNFPQSVLLESYFTSPEVKDKKKLKMTRERFSPAVNGCLSSPRSKTNLLRPALRPHLKHMK